MALKALCRVSAVLVVFVACAYECFLLTVRSWSESSFTTTMYGLLTLVFSALSILCIDIIHQKPADSFTFRTMIDHYYWFAHGTLRGFWVYLRLQKESKDITKYQDMHLKAILEKNKTTDYAKDHGVDKVNNSAEFRKNVPFGTYDSMKKYMERLIDGDYKAVTNDEVKCVVYTSGTSGTKKYWPFTKSLLIDNLKAAKEYSVYCLTGRSMGRTLMLYHTYGPVIPEPGKPPIVTASSFAFRHRSFWVFPLEVSTISEDPSFMYCAAIFTLKERELDGMKTNFSVTMYSFWAVLCTNWKQICDDIENGRIKLGTLKVDEEKLEKINSYLTPDPERAEELRIEFRKGFFRIARRLWPRIQYVDMVCTGALSHPAKLLQENQLYGIPILGLSLAASEYLGGISTGTEVDDSPYSLYTLNQYFEWIPEERVGDTNPETLETAQVEIGQSYEIVVTTYAGLTRYRSGDIVKVVDKFNQLPKFVFCYRYGQLLDLAGEKMTEKILYDSITKTCEELNIKLMDYTCTGNRNMNKVPLYLKKYEDPTLAQPHYLLFCEFARNGRKTTLSEKDRRKFDENLRADYQFYDQFRSLQNLREMKIFEMKEGAFQALKCMILESTRNEQFKMPRVICNPDYLEFLMSKVEFNEMDSQV